MTAEIPIACSLEAAHLTARLAEMTALGRAALMDVRSTPGGAELRFVSGEGVRERVQALAEAESECCAFLTIQVRDEPGLVVLTIEAPIEAEALVGDLVSAFRGGSPELIVRYVGGATAVVELPGLRILLDPTFDPPGEYPVGERVLTKTQPPAVSVPQLGQVDAVLLSHDQHPDNLDRLGRDILMAAPIALSTPSAARRLGSPVHGLANWTWLELSPHGGDPIRVTGVPAQHGPDGSEALVGEVTGFVLSGPAIPTVYVSGDNASPEVAQTINERLGPFEVVILNAGAARTALAGGAPLTLTSEHAAEVVASLGCPPTVALHFEGWAHFTEGAQSLRDAFEQRGISDCLHIPAAGVEIRL